MRNRNSSDHMGINVDFYMKNMNVTDLYIQEIVKKDSQMTVQRSIDGKRNGGILALPQAAKRPVFGFWQGISRVLSDKQH